MTWINSVELERLRDSERVNRNDLEATRTALNKASTITKALAFEPVAPYVGALVCDLAAAQVRADEAEARVKTTSTDRDILRSQRDSARADLADVRKVLDAANSGPVPILVGYSSGGVETKVTPKSATVAAAERLASQVAELKATVKAQREKLDAIDRQREQEAVDAEYAALPVCPMYGHLQCPRCARSISSPRLSDNVDQPAEMYGVITLATLAGQGGTVALEPPKPKLPQHLVWRCACGHVEKTKTRDAS
ncbi:hypothetical protein [Mycobacteroides chelonae]|uniref:hypothetical protein n=1 Tax=Mycobacteroides chelonae TaxID=1774 RepID=UPI0008AA4EA4|nr:hypothetical protein [Mycobacteroides chelonae]MBF9326045.1 hypothetical protein [Mycobacteroides chelonae]MBF9420221.1 hypothetical protein [Mycobacteroides chelonae]MBF9438689.1 hypothetical protein [Mycobacteroides chelonae]MBV6359998.1 hypothetical protein [Mycobacteroides chelonae]MEC4834398.1 hypothetical protein [Mycobacteroides chelonae]